MTTIGALGVVAFLLAARRGSRSCVALVLLALPFGATAAVTAGPMTLLLAHMLGLLLVAGTALRWIANGAEWRRVRLHPAVLILLALTAWAMASGFLVPRLLLGEVMVVPANMGEGMFGVDRQFGTYVRPLAPSSGNVSQVVKAGIVLLVFACALSALDRPPLGFVRRSMAGIASVHIGLTVGQLALGDPFSSLVHTADYVIHAEQTFAGMRRVVGGFAEPSSHGGFSAALYGYFLACAVSGGRRADAAWAVATGVVCLASLSSTAVAVFVLATAAGLGVLCVRIARGRLRVQAVGALVVGGAALGACFVFAGGVGFAVTIADGLLLSKADSLSGLERGYWARHGFDVLRETHMIGAGMGSVRSNGLFAAIAGNLGLPGLILSGAFLGIALAPLPRRDASPREDAAVLQGLRGAVVSSVCAASLSATGAGLGLGLCLFCAMALAVRRELSVQKSLEGTRTVSPGSIAVPGPISTGSSVA